jgi:hypothetical protein
MNSDSITNDTKTENTETNQRNNEVCEPLSNGNNSNDEDKIDLNEHNWEGQDKYKTLNLLEGNVRSYSHQMEEIQGLKSVENAYITVQKRKKKRK